MSTSDDGPVFVRCDGNHGMPVCVDPNCWQREPPEMVDHPDHYGGKDNPYEVIKVLKAWLSREQYIGFLLGNSLKYNGRLGKKGARSEDARPRQHGTRQS